MRIKLGIFTLIAALWCAAPALAARSGQPSFSVHDRSGAVAPLVEKHPTFGVHPAFEPRPPEGLEVECSQAEVGLFADAADGQLDNHRLLVAGLIASGATQPETIVQYSRRFEATVAVLKSRVGEVSDETELAARTLRYLHDHILTGRYQRETTTLTAAFDRGDFNCVSSAILFQCFARALGLHVRGVQVPGHAYSVVQSNSGQIEVQTTCRNWFERGAADHNRLVPGQPAAEMNDVPRLLSDTELVAMVYFNRGVTAIRSGEFIPAVGHNFKALWLDPRFEKAKHNLLASLDQWGASFRDQGRVDAAIEVISYGLAVAPENEIFQSRFDDLCQSYVAQLLEGHDYADALALLERAAKLRDNATWVREARRNALRYRNLALPPTG